MKIPSVIPTVRRPLVEKLVGSLSAVPGVQAVVLGGSFARGTHHAASDLDIGIYYLEASPFEIDEIRRVAAGIALEPPTVTGFYNWGRWVNGGAWIHTSTGKLDFLYRNLDQVQRTIDEAIEGKWTHDYDQQPAFGFYSVIYLGETSICLPLYDPNGLVARLKQAVAQYPPRLKQRILSDSLWSVEFTLLHARSFAAAGDVYGTVGCLTRAASNLTQALYALNETYFISDKKALAAAAAFPLLPPGYLDRLSSLLGHTGQTPADLANSVSALESLFGRLRRHQRRISGRQSTRELNDFGQIQVLFRAQTQTELLHQIQQVPLPTYHRHRQLLAEAEAPRQFLYHLHRNPFSTTQTLLNQHAARRFAVQNTPNSS